MTPSHLDESSGPRRSTSCARSPPSGSTQCCSSRAARARSCCGWLEGVPAGEFPFPLMHVDTGHNFPRGDGLRNQRVARAGERLVVSEGSGVDGHGVASSTETGPVPRATQLRTNDPFFRHDHGARFRRRDGREAPPRRGARPVPSASSASTTTSGSGSRARSGQAVEPLRRRIRRTSRSASSRSRSSTARHLAVRRPANASSWGNLLRARARVYRRDGIVSAAGTWSSGCRRATVTATVRFSTVGDMTCTGAVESHAATIERS